MTSSSDLEQWSVQLFQIKVSHRLRRANLLPRNFKLDHPLAQEKTGNVESEEKMQ